MKYPTLIKTMLPVSGLAVLCAFALPISTSCAQEQRESVGSTVSSRTIIHPTTVIPITPTEVQFAGETISLDRYDMFERFDRELTTFCYTHSTTTLLIKRANRYFPDIVPILKAQGMPEDFKYLACIESFMNPRAYSPARAAGLWQMLASTAKMYGLEVNDYVDERYHPEKATVAACKYLKEAYGKYHNWTTAAASYNAGMGRISTELKKQAVENSFDLLLVEETSRYVFRMLAIKTFMENPAGYGFQLYPEQLYQPLRYKEVVVTSAIPDMTAFAQEHGITYRELKENNPWLRSTSLPNKGGKTYKIRIPLKEDMYNSKRPQNKTFDPRWVVGGGK